MLVIQVKLEELQKLFAQALEGFQALARTEGIIPALEPSHVIGWLMTRPLPQGSTVLVCLSGRGDKDLDLVTKALGGSGG